jgi:hypothetical protein
MIFFKLIVYMVLGKEIKSYHKKKRARRRVVIALTSERSSRDSSIPWVSVMSSVFGLSFFSKLFDLSLHIFPHMAVEREPELAEGAGEDSPFGQCG